MNFIRNLPGGMVTFARRNAGILIAFMLFAMGSFAVYRLLEGIDVHAVVTQLKAVSPATAGLAFTFALAGYAALVGYDWLALRYVGKTAPPGILVFGSFTAYALSNTIGLAVFSGGAIRYRFYRGLGLQPSDIAVVSTFCAVSFGIGVTLVGLAALAWHPDALSAVVSTDPDTIRLASIAFLAIVVSAGLWLSVTGRSFQMGRQRIGLSSPMALGAQILLSLLDIIFAAATLYVLVPSVAETGFPVFVAIFAVAAVAAVLSHVPGGIGVFESVIIAGITAPAAATPAIAAALIAYRIIYYLVPFILALAILAVFEAFPRRALQLPKQTNIVALATLLEGMRPALVIGLSALVFMAGATFLLNGILPIPREVVNEITPLVPLELFEMSNIVMGTVGGVLIIIANGLRQRIRGAWLLTMALLVVAVASLLVQRLDFDLAVAVTAIAILLWLARDEFYRSSKLTMQVLSIEWLLLAGGLVVTAAFLFLFAHSDTQYSDYQWWQFAFDRNTPRALRILASGLTGAIMLFLVIALRPARSSSAEDDACPADAAILPAIVDGQDDPNACFVYSGDKQILMAPSKDAFIMFAGHGRSLIALGDPIGNVASMPPLIDTFVTMADRSNRRPVFYQVGPQNLELWLDFGFMLSKLGEEAVVPLEGFSLEGSQRRRLRQAHNHALRHGLSFSITQPPHEPLMLSELKIVSNAWLVEKKVQEKAFSLGRFDESYLQRSALALVHFEGECVAFANILRTGTRKQATIDLMRYTQKAPAGTMDFLFIELMLALKAENFSEFSLGLAPLSGLEHSRHKRLWDRFGLAIVRLGGHFYNFEGLRDYKAKFDPNWRPRYMATWGGVDPLLAATDVNALVSGGLVGAVAGARRRP